jgi:DNA mismatch repair protein MutL
MKAIINLLPDSLANQIAAGEVVQRPASVVKELMENAIDAGSNGIRLILKDSGKTMIQVMDDGKGMSEVDARMCFERHATSKISCTDDLFHIDTLGFRGEALASIAAISRVELKTKTGRDNLGSRVLIEGSKVVKQEPTEHQVGTSIIVKNLFYNVPARRKFLKSDAVELKHILEEFIRVALPNHDIFFSAHHNENELYHLHPSNLRQRIVNIFGKGANEKIVPVDQEVDFIKIHGFAGKPSFIKKSRGDQYFFVNKRFIRSNYLHHAIRSAYEKLIPSDHQPFYVLMLEIDPALIDVNIHPTKQEIKFENERLIYNMLRVSVKHALGKYSVTPSIDFEVEDFFLQKRSDNRSFHSSNVQVSQKEKESWSDFYQEIYTESSQPAPAQSSITLQADWTSEDNSDAGLRETTGQATCFQYNNNYIVSPIKSGILVIDQKAAHQRVLYERFLKQTKTNEWSSQQCLFPESFALSPAETSMIGEMMPVLKSFGFDIEKAGQQTFMLKGRPAIEKMKEPVEFLQALVSSLSNETFDEQMLSNRIATDLAKQNAIERGQVLTVEEMKELIDELFACEIPYTSPTGQKCFVSFGLDELQSKFSI